MGIVAIKLPDIGEGIAEAELTELYVKIGDLIAEDEVIADVMTDKATVEVPSSRAGRVAWVGGAVGDTLAIGADLIRLEVNSRTKTGYRAKTGLIGGGAARRFSKRATTGFPCADARHIPGTR